METGASSLKRTLVIVVAFIQFCAGAMLLAGTIGIAMTASQTVVDESALLAENLTAFADALDASCAAYRQSASSIFGLTSAMDDVAEKLGGVKETMSELGAGFANYGKSDSSWYGKVLPFTEWFRGSGEKLKEVARDVEAVSEALRGQSAAIKDYRENGYEKSLAAISKSVESLRRSAQMLEGGRSAGRWWRFVCVLGICVSMLFFANGLLLLVVAKGKTVEWNCPRAD